MQLQAWLVTDRLAAGGQQAITKGSAEAAASWQSHCTCSDVQVRQRRHTAPDRERQRRQHPGEPPLHLFCDKTGHSVAAKSLLVQPLGKGSASSNKQNSTSLPASQQWQMQRTAPTEPPAGRSTGQATSAGHQKAEWQQRWWMQLSTGASYKAQAHCHSGSNQGKSPIRQP